ncbi:hypothetical protein QJS10_CPB11g00615 [Acorus calamus]|uniref:Uncharacterized protein n=1 Tax=Acorus calamus TaxID=4465 RepID=A0AAV9DQ01_ACOCL|nr:hypothetical protein QJS10_CPB11g00615 [Acorus calamus]
MYPNKPAMSNNTSTTESDNNRRRLEHEIRDTVTALTRRLSDLQSMTKGHEESDRGMKVITLAGSNMGATMRANLDEISEGDGGIYADDETTLSAYANSNYQAVNNSIVLDGSCDAEDPGVHIVITDYASTNDHGFHEVEKEHKKEKKKDKEKEKEKEKEKKKGSVKEEEVYHDKKMGD